VIEDYELDIPLPRRKKEKSEFLQHQLKQGHNDIMENQ
jgi:hypothetical protein